MSLQQKNDLQVISKAELKPSQYCKHHCKRKLVNNCGIINQHDVLERFKLISDAKNGEKFSDDHINPASQLLHGQFGDVQGLCLPVLELSFPRFEWASEYVGYAYFQILHTGSDHWIAIKATSENV